MKTRIEVHRGNRDIRWEGDLPLLYEGLLLTLPEVAATRITTVMVHVGDDGPTQIIHCAP